VPSHAELIAFAFIAGLADAIATGLGALPAALAARASDRLLDGLLGFAGGIMISVTAFGLLLPAFDSGGVAPTAIGLTVGAGLLALADRTVPHLHLLEGPEGPRVSLQRAWLIVLAITIHNFPEGLAVGVTFGRGDLNAAIILAIGIGIQDMPEGLAVALPLVREGYSSKRAISYAALTGLAEPLAALAGVSLIIFFGKLMSVGLAFAAGCMVYVVFDEIIPESFRRGHREAATTGALAGFILMTSLERLFA
jgi:zinc transporter, ZIP family